MSRQRGGFDPFGADRDPDRPAREAAPEPVAEAAAALVARRGWRRRLEGARVHDVWEEAAGAELARHVTPVRLHGGVLVLEADSATWATQVRYLTGDLAARVNAALGEALVERVTITTRGRQRGGRDR